MSALAHSTNALFNPDRNPLLKMFLKRTFYAQYCAGENAQEVRRTVNGLKEIGFTGVILGYAREVVLTEEQSQDLASCADGAAAEECIRNEVTPWATGTMETVRLARPGDFVALKFTGAGRQALFTLQRRFPPPTALASSIDSICALAASRGVRLLFDAEQVALQPGIDAWTLDYMRKYNKNTPDGNAIIYGTYQAYLLSTPATLANHLAAARKEGFVLGVKLVRGAYLGSDPRHMMHTEKAGTDAAYDGIAEALLTQRWTGVLADPETSPGSENAFPAVSLVLASHNANSVRKAREIRAKQVQEGSPGRLTELSYAQLQGMADEVSCALLAEARAEDQVDARPKAYKYLVWGTTGECMKYLLRRAQENKDAIQRTLSGRDAMRAELVRRMKAFFGLSS